MFLDNVTEDNNIVSGRLQPSNTNENGEEGNATLSTANDNSFQEFERLIDNGSNNKTYSLEHEGNNGVTAHEGININSSSFATAEFFELQSIGDEELFTPEECYVEKNEDDSEKSIRLMDLLESKESCVWTLITID